MAGCDRFGQTAAFTVFHEKLLRYLTPLLCVLSMENVSARCKRDLAAADGEVRNGSDQVFVAGAHGTSTTSLGL